VQCICTRFTSSCQSDEQQIEIACNPAYDGNPNAAQINVLYFGKITAAIEDGIKSVPTKQMHHNM
jgi:hypothetical protein